MVASDLYVLFGLAVLAATGVALARERCAPPGRYHAIGPVAGHLDPLR